MTYDIELGEPTDDDAAYTVALVIADIVTTERIPVCVAYGPDMIARAVKSCLEGRSLGYVAITGGGGPTIGYSLAARTAELRDLLHDVLKRAAVICRDPETLS